MTKLSKILFLLVIVLLSIFFYFKKERDDTLVANNIIIEKNIAKNKEIEDIRNRPFPLAGMDTLPTGGDVYEWKTFKDTIGGITFSYPKELLTTYIHATTWPPKIIEESRQFVCNENGTEITTNGKTEKITIDSQLYCRTQKSEGAAGSIYTTYAYKTSVKNKIAVITFTLQAVTCANYDNPKKTECENERNTFNPNTFINKIATSIFFEGNSSTKIKGGIRGIVLLGPTCPVMRNQPDPACPDRPYTTKLILTSQGGTQNSKEFSSGIDGKFNIEIMPGDYTISNAPSTNILPRCTNNEIIHVVSNQFASTTVYCDSGIR